MKKIICILLILTLSICACGNNGRNLELEVKEFLISEWVFLVNDECYNIKFFEDNTFELLIENETEQITDEGKYSIKNGVIVCTCSSNDEVVKIPYWFENGAMFLDIETAFGEKHK